MTSNVEINAFAGIGAIQGLLRIAGNDDILTKIKVDGMLGTITYDALNYVASKILHVPHYVPQGAFDPNLSIAGLQRWYNYQRTCSTVTFDLPKIDTDGYWGDETFKAFQNLIMLYGLMELPPRTGNSNVGELARILKSNVVKKESAKPNVRYVDLKDFKNDPTFKPKILWEVMGRANYGGSVAELVNAGLSGIVAIGVNNNEPVAIIIYQEPLHSVGRYNYKILGVYVNPEARRFGIGKALIKFVLDKGAEEETSVWVNIDSKRLGSPGATSFFQYNNIRVNKLR